MVRVRYNTWSNTFSPCNCTRLIISGSESAFKMNCVRISGSACIIRRSKWNSSGKYIDLEAHNSKTLCLSLSSAGQTARRWTMSPRTLLQVSASQYPSVFEDQNLHKASVLYRPLSIFARTVALLVS